MQSNDINAILTRWQLQQTRIPSLEDLFVIVEKRTGHSIRLLPIPLPYSPSGLLVQIEGYDIDLILVANDTNFIHQHHICLHELAHIFCGHKAEIVDAKKVKGLLGQPFPADIVRAIMRSSFDVGSPEEDEAESLAMFLTKQLLDYQPISQGRLLRMADIDSAAVHNFEQHLRDLGLGEK